MSAEMAAAAERAKGTGAELARMLATLAWVVGGAAGLLAALGALPAWLTGGAGARGAGSIQEAEARLGARILLPAFQPARLGWPPAEIRTAGGRRGSVRIRLAPREGAPVELVQATEEGRAIAPALLADRHVLSERRTQVGALAASLATVTLDGTVWQELAFDVDGRAVLLRSRGDLDELYRIAHSLHGRGPHGAPAGGGTRP
jgi:hypothetical protein